MPSQAGGSFGADLLKSSMKGLVNLGRKGASEAIKSDYAKQKIKNVANKYLDQALDSFSKDISDKLDPFSGKGIDIHKMIGKLPKPKAGWTPGKYKYMGAYNPLDKQLKYDPVTGEVLEWHVKPYNKVDEISAHHDICYDMGKNKGDCDKKMVESLDKIPYGEMPKWGQTARFLINTKQKLGMGVKKGKSCCLECAIADKSKLGMGVKKSKNGKSRRVKNIGK